MTSIKHYRSSVTFEYQEQAPETYRAEIDVSNPSLGARRAVEGALRAYPRRHWSSVVVVLELERPRSKVGAAAVELVTDQVTRTGFQYARSHDANQAVDT